MLVAVTGAGGHVGTNLVARLLADGHDVRTLEIAPPPWLVASGADVHAVDVTDPASTERALGGVEVVFHLAARITLWSSDPDAWRTNATGTATVAAAALRCGARRFVHCSSVHSFDQTVPGRLDESSPRAVSPRLSLYDRSMWAAEQELARVIDAGLNAVIVNPTGIVGPVDPVPSRVGRLLLGCARGRMPVVVGGGFDWVDVRDVVDVMVRAVDRGRTGQNYLVPGHRATALELAKMASRAAGRRGSVTALPLGLARRVAPAGELVGRLVGSDALTPASLSALAADPVVSGDRARQELGHVPRPLPDTVADLISWFRDAGRLRRRSP